MRRILLVLILLALSPLAHAQPADPDCRNTDANAVEELLANLRASLPQGCTQLDFKALGRRIKSTQGIGFFEKLRLVVRGSGINDDALAYDANPTPQALAKLQQDFDEFFDHLVAKLGDKDPELAKDLVCARGAGAGLPVLLMYARRENEKKRNGG